MIIAHELAHIELHGRIGEVGLLRGALPAWFDEGLAVIVSKDERYLEILPNGELSCVTTTDEGDLPASISEWGRVAGQGKRPIYAMVACRTLNWLHENDGADGVRQLAEKLNAGGYFSK
ncbi:MAG: hypothetical protein MPJ78_11745 [Hyphomicrobiaceae bacterium]|nr:hypothetical protein [Hyphomicrobiaceae bacterium]